MLIEWGGAYIGRHWRGELSLPVSFWINFFLIYLALALAERFFLTPYMLGEVAVIYSVTIFSIVAYAIIYPWQIIGVIRACERHIKNRAGRSWAIAAEGVVVLSIVATLAMAFSSYQSVLGYQRSLRLLENSETERVYELDLIRGNTLIHLRGFFEVGITRQVSRLLNEHRQITGIILDSGGGQIYEGRGLARLIKENKLATYSLQQCVSSCATAFIAGTRRRLGVDAKLGFHQYKKYAVMPPINIDQEQAKDRALFEAQGISPTFLRKMFAQPPDKMWWPNEQELLDAGVVHETGFSL